MLNIRLLEPERFDELPIEANPATSIVAVAEDHETKDIKAYWMAQLAVHVEPVWLSPEVRDGGFTGLKLYAALLAALNGLGVKDLWAFADTPDISNYLERLKLTLAPFIIYKGSVPELPQEVKECPSSQQSSQPPLSVVEPE